MSDAPVHASTPAEPHHKVNYLSVFILLVALTIVTVGVAFLNIRSELAKVLLALTIASIKAAFVILFFMHLKFEGKLIYLILAVPLTFCILLVIALLPDISFGHIFHDFLTGPLRHAHQ